MTHYTQTEFMRIILFANRILNKVLNGIKTFFNRIKNHNNVEKPVGGQNKTHEFGCMREYDAEYFSHINGFFVT